ncbi:MAG: hypothetical protein GX230_02475 [Lentisphaerae bacterium]|nr:hypothetical protein [Lentisphaerota bacterium]
MKFRVLLVCGVLVASLVTGTEGVKPPLPLQDEMRMPPPMALWGSGGEVDSPESAFYSIGRTLFHFGHNGALIAGFHGWLREQGIDPLSLLPGGVKSPQTARRILLEPELLEKVAWKVQSEMNVVGYDEELDGAWIVGSSSARGAAVTMPLVVEREGRYRLWVRFYGHDDGTAVTGLRIRKVGGSGSDLLYDEIHSTPQEAAGPAWHDIMVDLKSGEYRVSLEHVVRYYQADSKAAARSRMVDCIYLTDELWREAPSAAERAAMRRAGGSGVQFVTAPQLDGTAQELWRLWQVRPLDWEEAAENEALFRQGYCYWQEKIAAIAAADYKAEPLDPVAKGVPDYRDPRRQVVFDPVWNMVANPYRAKQQREILKGDVDPNAKDAFFGSIFPGKFPVVRGQWQRSGGGLSADHGATKAFALGSWQPPHGGEWHLWINFKNINYFEYYGVFAETVEGRQAVWERKERLYPGGRSTWAKVGTISVPSLDATAYASHKGLAAEGVFVTGGKQMFAHTQGVWSEEAGALIASGSTNILSAGCAMKSKGDFNVRARLSVSDIADSGAAFQFCDGFGLERNSFGFDGKIGGTSIGGGSTNQTAGKINDGQPFDLEVERRGSNMVVGINGFVAGLIKLKDEPRGAFGFTPGKGTLRLYDFSATGDLDDGLAMQQQINIGLWIDKYINARTYRGIYGMRITDDADYVPEGSLLPKPSPKRFFSQLADVGVVPEKGYGLNTAKGIEVISQTWMPRQDEEKPELSFVVARDGFRNAGLMFKSAQFEPVVVRLEVEPLRSGVLRSYKDKIKWRVVGFAPYGGGREAWTPFFLLRRPFMSIPPLGAAQIWLSIDTRGMAPGNYTSKVRIIASDWEGKKHYPERALTLKVRVADVAIAPERPILLHGWVNPPAGEEYRRDWHRRLNVRQSGKFYSKSDMEKYNIMLQVYPLWNNSKGEVDKVLKMAQEQGLDYSDWIFQIADEPTGTTAAALKKYTDIGKMIRATDPKAQIMMNPGEAARAATFKILQPYVDMWNPYQLHLTYGPSGRDYLKKPWIWYATSCYQDKSPGMAKEIYGQIRSVLSKPADCRGTAFFAPYYPWRDPWDTAHEHIKDVSVFVLPSRHGPVATPAWEATLEAVHHANLARMVREQAKEGDDEAKKVWESGGIERVVEWLEQRR